MVIISGYVNQFDFFFIMDYKLQVEQNLNTFNGRILLAHSAVFCEIA